LAKTDAQQTVYAEYKHTDNVVQTHYKNGSNIKTHQQQKLK